MAEQQIPATALVTGAALRLGRAIALDLAKRGWRIGVHHNTSGAEAQALVEEIERLGSKAIALPADLTNEDQLRGLEAGANHYLAKSSFHDNALVEAVRDLIGDAEA